MDDPKAAKAEAKAAEARAKSLRPRYKKKRFILGGALLLLIIIAAISSAGGDKTADKTASNGDKSKQSEEAKIVGLNQPARDGKFEFTVKGIECGKSRVGNATFGKDAQGQYCFVSLKVTNIGKEPQTMFADNQKLFDAQDREFSADGEAQIYSEDSKTLFEEINPGNSIEGFIIYDIPKDATAVKVELHDSAFSGGVVVKLS